MKITNPLLKRRTLYLAAGVLSISLLLLGGSACQPTASPTNSSGQAQSPGEQLVKASKDAGVNIHPEEVFTLSRGTETITGAPIAGWEQIPATAHANGVEIGYAFISSEEPRIPAGYYRLKGFVQANQVGRTEGRVQLIDQGGKVATELPSQVEIHSLTVPAEAARSRSFVTALTENSRSVIWFRCPNGVCFRFDIMRPRLLAAIH